MIVGGVTSGIDNTSIMEGVLTSASMQTVTETGEANDWDSTLTHTAAITAGTVTNAAVNAAQNTNENTDKTFADNFKENLRESKPALTRGIVSSSVERIAEEKGLDAYTSEALSTVTGSIAADTVSGKQKNIVWDSVKYATINTGLIAISNETKLSPAEDAIIQNSATALLNGENLGDSTLKSLTRTINFGEESSPITAYDKAAYQNKVNNFGKRTSGGEKAVDILRESATASFRQGAVEDIVARFESLKERFSNIPKNQVTELEVGNFCQTFPEAKALVKNTYNHLTNDISTLRIQDVEKGIVYTELAITLDDVSIMILKIEFDAQPNIQIIPTKEVDLPQGNSVSSYDGNTDNFAQEQMEAAFDSAKNIGEGFAERYQSSEYNGITPESAGEIRSSAELANFLDKNIGEKIPETADIQAEYVSDILSHFGPAGESMAVNYVFEIKAKAFIAQAMFEGATDLMRAGSEINVICEDVRNANKAYSEGNEKEGYRCVGRAMASLTKETARVATISIMGQSVVKGINPKAQIISGETEVVKDSVQTYYKGVRPLSHFDKNDPLKKGFRAKYPRRVNSPDNMAKQILEDSNSPYVSITKSKKIATDKYSILKGPEGPNQFISEGKVYKIKLKKSEVINPRDHLGKVRKQKYIDLREEAMKKAKDDAERLIYKKIDPENIERIK
ncbi:MAG: hypothetical protein HY761_09705 [Candidatus Omnitrophica bacterium]|nr:hypothetical protein [Candidatus Omnitrophota bacterium]